MGRFWSLLLLWSLLYCSVEPLQVEAAKAMKSDTYERIIPERLDINRRKRDLSTFNEEGHDKEATFLIKAFNKKMVVRARRNTNLLAPSFTVRYFKRNDSEVLHRANPEHCYYHGTVHEKRDSVVALRTCKGLSGFIDDGETVYHIEPDKSDKKDGAHIIYPARDEELQFPHGKCGNIEEDGKYTRDENERENQTYSHRRVRRDIDDFYRKYFTTDETRYTELLFVVDYGMYKGYKKDTKRITDRVITLANAVDAIYKRINIRIVVVGLEIWSNGDRISRSRTGGADLSRFRDYRNKNLVSKFHHDNAQLLSEWWWKGVGGVAYVTAMCGGSSVGVNRWDIKSIIGPYVILAHEMGHNFGMNHDKGACKCLTPRGCIMGGHKTRVPGFSDCSMIGLQKINDKCLYNSPEEVVRPQCGNGIREEGEECDCGSVEMCKKDPCCQPNKCILKEHAQCSDLLHECCSECVFKKQGTLCRDSETDCDAPEYCTGDSEDCPEDSYLKDGSPCDKTSTLLMGNTNFYSMVTTQLQHRIQARYVEINPQYWHGWICMRMELLGCDADEESPTLPTPIKAYNDYCLQPKFASCSPPDNTELLWKRQRGTACSENYKQFRLAADGVLIHHCSGKRVCPQNSNNGAKLVISGSCASQNSKFVRTKGKSLKHVQSNKCVHTGGGWPGDNKKLILWNSCDERRLEIWFMKADCVVPLGVQSGEIEESQMYASSSREKDLPEYGRLGSKKYWCAAEKDKYEWLEIDLGKSVTISGVQTQGRGNWYDWVTGYHLYYSDDGDDWYHAYTENEDLHSNSMCYEGTCSELRDTQCRDLWGAASNSGADGCYRTLNTGSHGYGTCDPTSTVPCKSEHALCGQLQCLATKPKPVVDYGSVYKTITVGSGDKCSAAKLKHGDAVGRGMVAAGTKCGDGKMCVDNKCQTFSEIGIKQCPVVNGEECSGRGVCLNTGECQCEDDYDPVGGCAKVLVPRDGQWGEWSSWTLCDKGCNGGRMSRHRFCDSPTPAYGGEECSGDRFEKQSCNSDPCPKIHSCRHLLQIGIDEDHNYPDGVYDINLRGRTMRAYCDMSRDGGGWTLLVTSHTNSWTAKNVKVRNLGNPRLDGDYSMLFYADDIKNLKGSRFLYRLEAQGRGRWGGIWKAPREYTFTATNNDQISVERVKKFDNWQYSDNGIEQRMPWISNARLTTSRSATHSWWGSITGDDKNYHPAPWISGKQMERQPEYIWYWMREGSDFTPQSNKGGQQSKEISIKATEAKLCVQPKTGSCNPPEGTPLIFYSKKEKCDDRYMVFTFDNGILRHKCSGMIVCPEGNGKWNKEMRLQKTCDMETAKHERLPSGSLKNRHTGFCVHPYGGIAKEKAKLVYWNHCGLNRISLTFINL